MPLRKLFKWAFRATACIALLSAVFIAQRMYFMRETGVGLCFPDEIQSKAVSAKGVTAEIHLCGEAFGSYYYLDMPFSPFSERKVTFNDSTTPSAIVVPKVEWIDVNTLKVIVPKWMKIVDKKASFNGVELVYEETQ